MPKRTRRTWTVDQKQAILAEANEPGAVKKAVAARHGIGESLLYQWQRELAERDTAQTADDKVKAMGTSILQMKEEFVATMHATIEECKEEITRLEHKQQRAQAALQCLDDNPNDILEAMDIWSGERDADLEAASDPDSDVDHDPDSEEDQDGYAELDPLQNEDLNEDDEGPAE